MRTVAELLQQVRTKGVLLTIDGDRLRFKGPKGAMTDELKQRIQANREQIIALLQIGAETPYRERPPYPDDQGRVKCCYCSHLDLTESRAVCSRAKQGKMGISLLTECSDFIMRTVH